MAKQHNALTGASLHEPKGVAAATVDTIYAADGAGSGTHRKVTANSMDKTDVKNVNLIYLEHKLLNVSAAKSEWMVCPLAGKITKIWCVIDGTIATADAVLTFEIGGVLITGSTITITASGSAAADVDSATPSALNVLTIGQPVEIITSGASTNAVDASLLFEIDVT